MSATKNLDESASSNGESKRGEMMIDAANFPDQAGEQVLIQAKARAAPVIRRSPQPCATSSPAWSASGAVTMKLLGRESWYLPRPLHWLLKFEPETVPAPA